jgi:dimethylargininase
LIIAITREVSPSIGKCELTHLPRQKIDIDVARSQHLEYENVLKDMGCNIRRLSVEPNLPDSVFVEDTAIVLEELAIVTPPGATSRREETRKVAKLLKEFVFPYAYKVETVYVNGCLHLKSGATLVGEDKLLINRSWIETHQFGVMEYIDVDPAEPHAANAMLVGGELVYPKSFPKTLRRLESRGISVRDVNVSELQKAEGAVSCCSLIFEE